MKVAFVGLGSMGAPQARLIARSGLELAVYDPDPRALGKFEGIARLAASAADAAQGADVACVCVRDDKQVLGVVLGEGGLAQGLAEGALLLVHSTIKIDTLKELEAALTPRGIALADAPVSRTRRTDDDPFVFTMLGGKAADVERARIVAGAYSTGMEHIGPLGAGMATKIANNMVTWVQLVISVQASNLAGHYGVPPEKLRAVMEANGNLTPTTRAHLEGKLKNPPGTNAVYDAFVDSQTGIGEKDLALAIASGLEAGMEMDVPDAARRFVRSIMTGRLVYVPRGEDG